jgi:uncharacterized SAM-binding protein YcdF (DUF218 family)
MIGSALLALYLLATPVVASLLLLAVSETQSFDPARAAQAQAIVICGGGIKSAPEYGGETLNILTLERTRHGARLARATGLPVLVSGGRPHLRSHSEAQLMRDALEREFGVPVRWVEEAARNTRENAQRSAAILRPAGVQRVVLVVHAFDVPRARAEFTAAGLEVLPAPTGVPQLAARNPLDYLPQPAALQSSYYALYEMAALAARPLR